MDDEKICIIAIIAAVLLLAGLAGLSLYDDYKEKEKKDDDKTEVTQIIEGDEVTVDYIGRFLGAGSEQGPVFDTSIREVADDATIPKSQGFMAKPAYDDLTFSVGSGQMVKGFEEAVLGKKEGQTFTVTIPPEKAYGPAVPELVYVFNTTQVHPLREVLSVDDFEQTFPGIAHTDLKTFLHPFWGWEITVLESNTVEVTIMHQPVYGKDYHILPWNVTVKDVSTERNTFTLEHQIYEIGSQVKIPFPEMAKVDPAWSNEAIAANSNNPPMEGYVTSKGGTITLDFNKEVSGKTLVFQITINKVKRVE
jgi:FKBP-type peptidyl-prolyl cis-trans isomerase 2